MVLTLKLRVHSSSYNINVTFKVLLKLRSSVYLFYDTSRSSGFTLYPSSLSVPAHFPTLTPEFYSGRVDENGYMGPREMHPVAYIG